MKILHLPVNIAFHPSETVKGLKRINIQNKIFVFASSTGINNPADATLIKSPYYFKKKNPVFIFYLIRDLYFFIKYLLWADLLHWYYDSTILPFKLDLLLVKLLRKPAVVEWAGSDIRIPEIEFQDNPYYTQVYQEWEYKNEESLKKSLKTQKQFKNAGFIPLVMLGMDQYIFKDLFPLRYHITIRYAVEDVTPIYPEPLKKIPLIVHTPSKTGVKGTKFIISAIELLKNKYSFNFLLIHGMTREAALDAMRESDIVVDQLIGGHHGMAAIEALSFGKPTICYLKKSGLKDYPNDLPIVLANPENIYDVLEKYLVNGELRYETGKLSRAYAEKYHDTYKIAPKLVEIYKKVIEIRQNTY